jgi:pyridoxal phosphate enzyme (YggS family)
MENRLLEVHELEQNWDYIQDRIETAAKKAGRNLSDIQVIAVSKSHPPELLEKALKAGIKVFGENYAQEIRNKNEALSLYQNKIIWHFIGHLQSNKIKYICPFIDTIQSVDTIELAQEISNYAEKHERDINILLQVNTSGEIQKSGCSPEDVFDLAEKANVLPNLKIKGIMTIGSFSENEIKVRSEFALLRSTLERLNVKFPSLELKELSMGMSGDYHWAVQDGATMLRIGTAIFGHRIYNED